MKWNSAGEIKVVVLLAAVERHDAAGRKVLNHCIHVETSARESFKVVEDLRQLTTAFKYSLIALLYLESSAPDFRGIHRILPKSLV